MAQKLAGEAFIKGTALQVTGWLTAYHLSKPDYQHNKKYIIQQGSINDRKTDKQIDAENERKQAQLEKQIANDATQQNDQSRLNTQYNELVEGNRQYNRINNILNNPEQLRNYLREQINESQIFRQYGLTPSQATNQLFNEAILDYQQQIQSIPQQQNQRIERIRDLIGQGNEINSLQRYVNIGNDPVSQSSRNDGNRYRRLGFIYDGIQRQSEQPIQKSEYKSIRDIVESLEGSIRRGEIQPIPQSQLESTAYQLYNFYIRDNQDIVRHVSEAGLRRQNLQETLHDLLQEEEKTIEAENNRQFQIRQIENILTSDELIIDQLGAMGVSGDNRDAVINSLRDIANRQIDNEKQSNEKSIIERIRDRLSKKTYKKGDEKLQEQINYIVGNEGNVDTQMRAVLGVLSDDPKYSQQIEDVFGQQFEDDYQWDSIFDQDGEFINPNEKDPFNIEDVDKVDDSEPIIEHGQNIVDIPSIDGQHIQENLPDQEQPSENHHNRIDIGTGDNIIDIHSGSPRLPDDNPNGGFPGGNGGPNHNRHYEDNSSNNPNNIHIHFNPYEKQNEDKRQDDQRIPVPIRIPGPYNKQPIPETQVITEEYSDQLKANQNNVQTSFQKIQAYRKMMMQMQPQIVHDHQIDIHDVFLDDMVYI